MMLSIKVKEKSFEKDNMKENSNPAQEWGPLVYVEMKVESPCIQSEICSLFQEL